MIPLSPPIATLEEHDAETRAAIAEAVAAEIDADTPEPDESLGFGYDEGPVLEHEP